jgi:putative transposase
MDEQVHVVVFAVELTQFRAHLGTQPAHDLLAGPDHLLVQHAPPISCDEDKMNLHVVDDTTTPANMRIYRPACSWTRPQTPRYGARSQVLQRQTYRDLKDMGLSAQPAIHVARKVVAAYTAMRANLRAGNYGPPGSRRRAAAESKPVMFRPGAAQPFDDRCLSWQLDRHTVSIWTTAGRLAGLRFAGPAAQLALLRDYRHGESDLVHRDGMWFLHATCEVPETPAAEPDGFLGVDLGIATLPPPATGPPTAARS